MPRSSPAPGSRVLSATLLVAWTLHAAPALAGPRVWLLGDSNTMGVYNALTGVYPCGVLQDPGWEVRLFAEIGAPSPHGVRVVRRLLETTPPAELPQVAVVGYAAGDAIGDVGGLSYEGEPILLENLVPNLLQIRQQLGAAGVRTIVVRGPGISPAAPTDQELPPVVLEAYRDVFEQLRVLQVTPVVHYRLPKRAPYWPTPPDWIHPSDRGYCTMGRRAAKVIRSELRRAARPATLPAS